MRVYFAGAICGGREGLSIYQHIVSRLKTLRHSVPTGHVAKTNVLDEERSIPPRVVYERDVTWIRESDAMIAEISTPSLGVGYEIGYALGRGMPVLCLYRHGLSVSKMITGNSSPHVTIATYRDTSELDRHIGIFLHGMNR
jgi:nucleoside 2-deoxyribosyltransferase